ncbi:hypothetical protein DITRI_Ditri14bG0139800 [Diplodiscus trichospermus]
MGSRLSSLRSNHGSIQKSRNFVISLVKGKTSSSDHTMATRKTVKEIQPNNHSRANKKSSSTAAKKALLGLKNVIERCARKLKIKNFLGKSGRGNKSKKSGLKRACCACISSEKRATCTNGLFKMKSFLLKGGGDGGDHGGSKGGNDINGGKSGDGVEGKKAQDQKRQK